MLCIHIYEFTPTPNFSLTRTYVRVSTLEIESPPSVTPENARYFSNAVELAFSSYLFYNSPPHKPTADIWELIKT